MDEHICTNCEYEHRTDEEEPVCPKCGGTMLSNSNRRESLKMIEEWMAWSVSMDVGAAMETLLFLTVVEAKNRNISAALYLRRLVEKWAQVDVALGAGNEVAEA
jgi:hypothetical protein